MFSFTDKDVQEVKSGGVVPEGEYTGRVEKAEVTKTEAGHQTIVVEMKLDTGAKLRERFNLEHPKSAEIAKKGVVKLLTAGVAQAKQNFGTFPELAAYLKGIPVKVRVKHREKKPGDKYTNYSLSFLDVDQPITKQDAAGGISY